MVDPKVIQTQTAPEPNPNSTVVDSNSTKTQLVPGLNDPFARSRRKIKETSRLLSSDGRVKYVSGVFGFG